MKFFQVLLFLFIAAGAYPYQNFHGCALASDNLKGWVITLDSMIILYTTDGGVNWQEQPNPATRRFFDVCCVDSLNAWTCGILGEILHTEDGGLTWLGQAIGLSKYATRIEFIDANYGWASCGDGVVGRTTDGGSFWEQVFTPFYNAEYYGVSFINRNIGWMVAGWPDTIAAGQGYIVRSTDGGMSWDSLFRCSNYEDYLDVYFFDGLNGIVVGGDEQTYAPVILKSNDSGFNWNQISAPANAYYLRAVDFVGNNGWAVGRFGTIIHTTDGGNSWTPQTNLLISPNGGENWAGGSSHQISWSVITRATLFDVDFSSNLQGLACGQNIVLYTTDGGQHWLVAEIPGTQGTGITGFRLLYSTDGGNSYPDTIATGISLDSTSWSWTLPVTNCFSCRVKIQALDDSNNVLLEDASDANFSIATYPTIISPDGSETWVGGSTHPITWLVFGQGFAGQRLLFSIDGGSNYSDTIGTDISPDSTSWLWTLPLISCSACRVKVQLLNISNSVIFEDEGNGTFSIILDEVTVYPNPYVPSRGHNYINFSKIPAQGKIIVYAISGERLWQQDVPNEGIYQWDTKIGSGKLLPSGFYYYLIKDRDGKIIRQDKFSVIR